MRVGTGEGFIDAELAVYVEESRAFYAARAPSRGTDSQPDPGTPEGLREARALGVHVVWAMPFGFLVMLAIFNRYDIAVEEAARDLGASALQTFTRVTLPIIWGGVFGAALFGFTLSWNEFERTLLISPTPTLPLEIYGELISATLQPDLYALGVITTFGTIVLVFLMLIIVALIVRRTSRTQAAALEQDEAEVEIATTAAPQPA